MTFCSIRQSKKRNILLSKQNYDEKSPFTRKKIHIDFGNYNIHMTKIPNHSIKLRSNSQKNEKDHFEIYKHFHY